MGSSVGDGRSVKLRPHSRGWDSCYKTRNCAISRLVKTPFAMDTDTISSNPAQILSGQHTAMLETTARKAFPAVTQSDLRLKFLDILLLIAQGSSAPDSQLDSFLVRNGNGRSCTVGDCGQTFKRRDRARDHIRVHLDYRPYACDGQCGKAEW